MLADHEQRRNVWVADRASQTGQAQQLSPALPGCADIPGGEGQQRRLVVRLVRRLHDGVDAGADADDSLDSITVDLRPDRNLRVADGRLRGGRAHSSSPAPPTPPEAGAGSGSGASATGGGSGAGGGGSGVTAGPGTATGSRGAGAALGGSGEAVGGSGEATGVSDTGVSAGGSGAGVRAAAATSGRRAGDCRRRGRAGRRRAGRGAGSRSALTSGAAAGAGARPPPRDGCASSPPAWRPKTKAAPKTSPQARIRATAGRRHARCGLSPAGDRASAPARRSSVAMGMGPFGWTSGGFLSNVTPPLNTRKRRTQGDSTRLGYSAGDGHRGDSGEQHDENQAGPHPVIALAQRLEGRPKMEVERLRGHAGAAGPPHGLSPLCRLFVRGRWKPWKPTQSGRRRPGERPRRPALGVPGQLRLSKVEDEHLGNEPSLAEGLRGRDGGCAGSGRDEGRPCWCRRRRRWWRAAGRRLGGRVCLPREDDCRGDLIHDRLLHGLLKLCASVAMLEAARLLVLVDGLDRRADVVGKRYQPSRQHDHPVGAQCELGAVAPAADGGLGRLVRGLALVGSTGTGARRSTRTRSPPATAIRTEASRSGSRPRPRGRPPRAAVWVVWAHCEAVCSWLVS